MQDLIVLDSIDAVVDLLEKRSELYSDRPTFVMHKLWASSIIASTPPGLQENSLGLDRVFPLMRYTPAWRSQRRVFHQYFQSREIAKYQPIQRLQCRIFIKQVLDDNSSGDIQGHLRLYVSKRFVKTLLIPWMTPASIRQLFSNSSMI